MLGFLSIQRAIRIFQLSLPVIAAMLSQSLMGIVDTIIVSHLGTQALAAVGAGNFSMYFCIALVAGLATAIQTQVSHRFGKHKDNYASTLPPLISGIVLTAILVIPLTLLLLLFSQDILIIVTPSSGVIPGSESYFAIRLLTLPAAAISLSFRGFWNGTHRAGIFLRLLLISHIINALISLLLVFGYLGLPALGIKGAAIGTFIAMYLSIMLNGFMLKKHHKYICIIKETIPSTLLLKRTLRLAFPDSLQQALFALGLLAFYGILARLGENAMAVGFIISNLTIFLILVGVGFGVAGASLTGQSIGAGNMREAIFYGWETSVINTSVIFLLSLPLLITPESLIAALSDGNDTLIHLGSTPLRMAAISIIVDGVSLTLAQTLLSAGLTKQVLVIRTITLWLIGLPLCLFALYAGQGLASLWTIQIIQRFLASLWLAYFWYNLQSKAKKDYLTKEY